MSGWGGDGADSRHAGDGPAAVKRLACALRPAAPFGGPLRDEGVVGSGESAQGGGLAGERLIVSAH